MQTAPGEIGRIIEFPRSSLAPIPALDELAEPMVDRPRIVDAPEITPPAPALGGIILEPPEPEAEKRPGFEIPLRAASSPRRILAGALDALIVTVACALFGYIFLNLTAFVPPFSQLLALGAGIAGFFWAGFQYLLLVYTGSTPGLRLARLRLSHFDGSPVSRRTRRWRVAASILSALSLGLGFAWCYLDEDALCWHDRITRTYLAPAE
ncbi:MAG TPA: RDD family protein [Terriglobales bacterium]|nr:RDD family protein [Terriglobales bacterium]